MTRRKFPTGSNPFGTHLFGSRDLEQPRITCEAFRVYGSHILLAKRLGFEDLGQACIYICEAFRVYGFRAAMHYLRSV